MRRPLRLVCFALMGAQLVACFGRIAAVETDDDPKGSDGPTGPGGSSVAGSGGQGGASAGTRGDTSPGIEPGPAPARRLTREEYLHTVNDLLGVELTSSKDLLPAETPAGGFRNQAQTQLASSVRTDALDRMAARIATTVPWMDRLAAFAPCAEVSAMCTTGFVERLGLLMYRRPLTKPEIENLARLFELTKADPKPFEQGARLVLNAMLQSPHFLYRLERPDAVDGHALLARLSFTLWKSAPSAPLLAEAGKGTLGTEKGLREVIETMLADPRSTRGLREFGEDWLQLYRLDNWAPDPKQGGSPELVSDMKEEALRFLARAWSPQDAPWSAVFTHRQTELTPSLAQAVYGVAAPSKSGFAAFDLSGDQRRQGLLPLPGVLGAHAGVAQSSLIHRGLAIFRNVLCGEVPVPPDQAAQKLETISPTLPERERLAQHRADAACAACHKVSDPLGYAFEVFDLIGRFRAKDKNGNVLREDGEYLLDGRMQPYANAAELSNLLAKSPSVERCLVHKYMQYAFGRPLDEGDEDALDGVLARFRTGPKTFRNLVLAVLTSAGFRGVSRGFVP